MFVEKNPNVRIAYSTNNKCALTAALANERFRIYSFLFKKNYDAGVDSKQHSLLIEKLPKRSKTKLLLKLRKHLKRPVHDTTIKLLLKSRDRLGSKENCKKLIDFYEALNTIPQISPILRLVAESDRTDIVFDFNNTGVSGLDPTTTGNPSGVTYHVIGYILIGAGRKDDEVLATIAHELTHYALQLVYNNDCQPFYADGVKDKQQYEDLIKKYKAISNFDGKCSEIAEVFDCSSYTTADINKELIVRLPQLLALHRNNQEIRDELRTEFWDLFDYFEQRVLRDVKAELLSKDQKEEISELNRKFGTLNRAIESNMLSSGCEKIFNFNRCLFIKSHFPELVLESVVKKGFDSKSIFVTLEQALVSKITEKLVKAITTLNVANIYIVDYEHNLRNHVVDINLLEALQKTTIILISLTKHPRFQDLIRTEINIDFGWDDLSDQGKLKVMEHKVIFQDTETTLKKIIENNELLIQDLPLENVLKQPTIALKSFYKNLPPAPRVFIKRNFYKAEKEKEKEYNKLDSNTSDEMECLHTKLNLERTVIIADSAGMGKSTSAVHLAKELKEKNPFLWVVFIDLKQHTKAFKVDGMSQLNNVDVTFFTEDLLKLGSTFEEKLFESFYENIKVIFIFDGFDEISPNYKVFVTNVLRSVKLSENMLLVTTRPHCGDDLKNALQATTLEIMPFQESDQIEFLTKYWYHKTMESDLESKIIELLTKLQLFPQPKDFYSIPIHIFMLAEMYDDQDLNTVENFQPNTYALYKNFISTKLKIWNEKGPLAADDSLTLHQAFPLTNLLHIFYKLAFQQLFEANEIENLNLPEISEDIINEMIARVGIVAFSSEGRAEFSHRTFAEHFVADFVFNSTLSNNPKVRIKELFIETMKKQHFGQVRKFMNDRLQNSNSKLRTEALADYFEKLTIRHTVNRIEEDDCYDYLFDDSLPTPDHSDNFPKQISGILDCIAEEKQTNLIIFMLETLNFNVDIKMKLAKEGLFKAVRYFESFQTIWNCVKTFSDENSIKVHQKELLFHRNPLRECLLKLAINQEFKGETEVTQTILHIAEQSLNTDDFIQLLHDDVVGDFLFGLAVKKSQTKFLIIWKSVCNKLGFEEQKKMLLGRDRRGNTCLHYKFCRDPDALSQYLEILLHFLNNDEIIDLVTARNIEGHVFMFYAHEYVSLEQFKTIWKFINENTNEATKRELIFSENNRKHILIEASIYGIMPPYLKAPLHDFIFEITETLLEEGENMIDFLRKRCCLTDVVLNTISHSKSLFEKCSTKLEETEFIEILLSKTARKRNILELLVLNEKSEEAMTLWNMAVEQINNKSEIERLLFEGRNFQSNVFRFAVRSKSHIFIDILKWCQINLEYKIVKRIFFERDSNTTVLHILFESGDISLIRDCLEFVSINFSPETRQKIFLIENQSANTRKIPLQEAFWNEDALEVIQEVWKSYNDIFDRIFLQKMISERYFFQGLDSKRRAHENIRKLFHDWETK